MNFRSETMLNLSLVFSKDHAIDILEELGNFTQIEICDTKTHSEYAFDFTHQKRDIEARIQKIVDLQKLYLSFHPAIDHSRFENSDQIKLVLARLRSILKAKGHSIYQHDLFEQIDTSYRGILDSAARFYRLVLLIESLIDKVFVLDSISEQLPNTTRNIDYDKNYGLGHGKFQFLCGSISSAKMHSFQKMVYRVGKGITFGHYQSYNREDILGKIEKEIFPELKTARGDEDEVPNYPNLESFLRTYATIAEKYNDFFQVFNDFVRKDRSNQTKLNELGKDDGEVTGSRSTVFLAIPSSSENLFYKKLRSLCELFGMNQFDFPTTKFQLYREMSTAIHDIWENVRVLIETESQFKRSFQATLVEGNPNEENMFLSDFKVALAKELVILENLSKFRTHNDLLEGTCWIPEAQKDRFFDMVKLLSNRNERLALRISIRDQYKGKPPTLIQPGKFMRPFQLMVNTYGVPKYKEANPALVTSISFPFFFGVMFGDVGHGLILLLISLYLFQTNEHSLAELKKSRYMVLMMALSAIYSGFIYNEFFSIPILTETCYRKDFLGAYSYKKDCRPSFGIDPIWLENPNGMAFINSYKMKISVIFGLIHMLAGLAFKAANYVYFGKKWKFWLEFVPQFLFMFSIFGYMVASIFLKWTTLYSDTSLAPSIITIMVNFGIKQRLTLWGNTDQQAALEAVILNLVKFCVLVMFTGMPIVHWLKSRQHANPKKSLPGGSIEMTSVSKKIYKTLDDDSVSEPEPMHDEDSEDIISLKSGSQKSKKPEPEKKVDLSEKIIHQFIETVEFVIGSISNTASYLRLWALSLAHSQLSKVFFEMLVAPYMRGGQSIEGAVFVLIFTFPIFLVVTFGIIIVMDVMECSLHALRLHWVEFQNKFFKGTGTLFRAFDFRAEIEKKFEAKFE